MDEQSSEWSKEDEQDLRCRIRDTMAKIEGISDGLHNSAGKAEGSDNGNGGRKPGTAVGSGPPRTAGRKRGKGNLAGTTACQAEDDGSIKNLHESLQVSMELAATGEKHASANTTAIEGMSEWLSGLEQKQLVSAQNSQT